MDFGATKEPPRKRRPRSYSYCLLPIAYSLNHFSTFTIGAATAEKVRSLPLAKRIFTR